MDKWRILGIEPTKDEDLIREAYMDKLGLYHPEEDPEGFQRLRNAYEEAIAEIDEEEEPQDNSPMGLWLQEVKACYDDFERRISIEEWKTLLNEEICYQLDTANEASEKLLIFLMDYYRLPHEVWALFDEQFNWLEKEKELKEKFPENFIEYVMNNINYESVIDYKDIEIQEIGLLDERPNIDEWLEHLFAARRNLNIGNLEETKKELDTMSEYPYFHPEVQLMQLRYYSQIEARDKALQIGEDLLEKYPNYIGACYTMSAMYIDNRELEKAKVLIDRILEAEPEHTGAKIELAEYKLYTNEIKEAEEMFFELLSDNPFDGYINSKFQEAEPYFIKYYEEESRNHPEDSSLKFKLAWNYFNHNDLELCEETVKSIEVLDEDRMQYYDVLLRVCSKKGELDEALEYIDKWLALNPEEKLDYIYEQQGILYQNKKEYGKAIEAYDKSLEYDKDALVYNKKAYCLNRLKRYQEAIETCIKGLELGDEGILVPLYVNKAEAHCEEGQFNEAMECCQITLSYDSYYAKPYAIKMKVFWLVGQYDDVLSVAERAKELGIEDDEIEYYKARAYEGMEKDEEAEKIYLNLIEKDTDNSKVYYNIAFLAGRKGQFEQSIKYLDKSLELEDEGYSYYLRGLAYKNLQKYEEALRDYEEAIKLIPNDAKVYNNKGVVLEKLRKFEEAKTAYKKALEINPEHETANNNLGELYDRFGEHEKALPYYTKQLELEKHDYYYINRAWCYIELNELDKAEEDFKAAIEVNENNGYAYNGLGALRKMRKKYDEAVQYFRQAIKKEKECLIAYENIIECYIELDDYHEQIKYCSLLIKEDPKRVKAYIWRGIARKNLKKYEKAKEDYLNALSIDPESAWAHNNLGNVYRALKEYETAIDYFKKAIKLDVEYEIAYSNIFNTWVKDMKDYKAAIKYFSEQMKLNEDQAYMYKYRAKANEKQGRKVRAILDYKKAIQLYEKAINEDTDACTYEDLGECYAYLKEFDSAINCFKKAIELAPECTDCSRKDCHCAYLELGKIYEKKDELDEAMKLFKMALNIEPDEEDYIKEVKRLEEKLNK